MNGDTDGSFNVITCQCTSIGTLAISTEISIAITHYHNRIPLSAYKGDLTVTLTWVSVGGTSVTENTWFWLGCRALLGSST